MERRRFFRKSRLVYLGIVVLVVLLNVAAWNSSAFADWYIAHVFPIWVSTYGRVSGLFLFSVGEWLIVAGLVVAGVAALLGIIWAGIGVVWVIGHMVRRLYCDTETPGLPRRKAMELSDTVISESSRGGRDGIIRRRRQDRERKAPDFPPVQQRVLPLLRMGAGLRQPDYDAELLHPVSCLHLFGTLFRRG